MLDKLRARLSGRSWWQVVYRSGKVISEWDAGADWLHLPRKGIVEGRLICPDGKVAVLGNSEALDERLYQFKVAHVSLGLAGGAQTRNVDAHIMGIVTDIHGNCKQYAWEYTPDGKGRLVGPMDDNLEHYRYGGPATHALCWPHLGVRPA